MRSIELPGAPGRARRAPPDRAPRGNLRVGGGAAGETGTMADTRIDKPLVAPLARRFTRPAARFRDWVSADGSTAFPAEAGRYHLYVSYACPWAHRTVIGRRLKGLEDVIGLSVVDPIRDERSWRFTGGEYTDAVNGFEFLSEAYDATDSRYEGRLSVPVLWDKETGRIVNNESA